MLHAASRRAQRALLSCLAAGVKGGRVSGGGFQRGSVTNASSSATTPATPYSPPKNSSPLREVPVPTLNFWESTRPSDWKVVQQYWFLGGVGALTVWATVKALTNNNNNDEGGNGAGEGKVSREMSPAKREMAEEQERSLVKKQVP